MICGALVANLRDRFARLANDERGLSAVEFALLLPLMLSLYIGAVEISQAVAVDRKVTLTARSVADLTAQTQTVNSAEMTDILNAAATVTAPYSEANLKVTVSQVKIDAAGKATIEWSKAKNTSARPVNQVVTTLPDPLKIPNSYLIWGEAQYTYTPAIGGAPTDLFYKMTGTKTLKDQIYMRPRLSDSVTCNNC